MGVKKVLSVKQPWASLLLERRNDGSELAIKDIENRFWKTNYRGIIFIHASKTWSNFESNNPLTLFTGEQVNSIPFDMRMKIKITDLPVSAILGYIQLKDIKNSNSIWAEKYDGEDKTIHHWQFIKPVKFQQPILNISGKLGLWEYPDTRYLSEYCLREDFLYGSPIWKNT